MQFSSTLDLNLLPIFLALMECGSVQAAAAHLGVSQSKVRNAMTSLRLHYSDRLLVFRGGSMEATPFATGLDCEVRKAFMQLTPHLAGARPAVPAPTN
ncbi:MAG: Transcriptional regulator, LysR family [Polaromonas sp.]|nr:Transcriptional regulator, LysR family [Polaromonas sp.]